MLKRNFSFLSFFVINPLIILGFHYANSGAAVHSENVTQTRRIDKSRFPASLGKVKVFKKEESAPQKSPSLGLSPQQGAQVE